jgi:adenine-specific DNA-methyltransferase
MAKIDITKTELVWPGKYNDDGSLREVPRVNLPFQVIERVNESRATREAKNVSTPSLFDFYAGKEGDTFADGWRNKLIWGDNLLVMGSLLEKFAGKVDLIYIDPPFDTGLPISAGRRLSVNPMIHCPGRNQASLRKKPTATPGVPAIHPI